MNSRKWNVVVCSSPKYALEVSCPVYVIICQDLERSISSEDGEIVSSRLGQADHNTLSCLQNLQLLNELLCGKARRTRSKMARKARAGGGVVAMEQK